MASGYDDFPAYVPVAQRLANGRRALEKLAKKRGRPLAPITLDSRHIATSFWGRAWCQHLETHSDFASRLPRGRTYVRNGSVLDLHIEHGKVEAHVAGSSLYEVTIKLTKLEDARWRQIIAACSGRIASLIGLLRGELAADVLSVLTDRKAGLFPAPKEIHMLCTCPDSAYMCKHVAAVLYGVGARLDRSPELFFLLRQVDQAELIASAVAADVLTVAGARSGGSGRRRLATSAIASVFGIELEPEQAEVSKKKTRKPPR
ncbi:MAG: SWIM zinc finger family protein [Polyangiales bacterium]